MKKAIKEIFSEPTTGRLSSMRVLVSILVSTVVGTWAIVSIHNWSLQPLDTENLLMLLGPITAQLLQKRVETKERS